jgi:Ca-activated chloride channel family protein
MKKALLTKLITLGVLQIITFILLLQCHPDHSKSQSIEEPRRDFNRQRNDEGVVRKAIYTQEVKGPVVRINDIKEGTMVRKVGEAGFYEVLPRLNTNVNISIEGMVATATVDQVFTNTAETPIEAIYVFPLPQNAAVYDMKMIVNDRFIQGVIKERKEAKATYEKAKREGKRTSLTEQERPNIFSNSLANIMPGDRIIVRLQYVERLVYEDGLFRIRFPMVVAPRYIPGTVVKGYTGSGWAYDTDIVSDASRITPPVVPPGMRTGNKVSMKVNIAAGLPVSEIRSVSHDIEVTENRGGHEINLKKNVVIPNRDFVLEYGIKTGREPRAALFTSRKGDEDYFMLMAVPPVEMDEESSVRQEMIFVIDISGSMSGSSIGQAKSSLIRALNQLRPEDYFNIIAFNNRHYTMTLKPVRASGENVTGGIEYVSALKADGGTEAQPALQHALTMFHQPDTMKMIIFITDGSVGNENDLISLVNQHIGESRLFAVGIGSAPNGHLLEKVSQSGRGAFTYISTIGDVEVKMGDLLSKIEKPALMDLVLDISDEAEILPDPIPDLFAGQPLIVFGRTKGLSRNRATLIGKASDGYFQLDMPLDLDTAREQPAIPTLWARSKIANLMDEFRLGNKQVKQDIINLAVEHRLLTKFTSFVAVEHKIVNLGGKQSRSVVPTELPEGWEFDKVFGEMKPMKPVVLPQTASNVPHTVLIGFILLSLGISMRFLRQRKAEINTDLKHR